MSGLISFFHSLSVLRYKKYMGFVWDTNRDLVCAHFVCKISSLPDILWIVVSRSVAPIIGASLRFTLRRPKHSYSAIEILVHLNLLKT